MHHSRRGWLFEDEQWRSYDCGITETKYLFKRWLGIMRRPLAINKIH